MDRPPFASLLRRLRQLAGLTQEELAARARVGVRTVRDLEAGRALRPQRSTVNLLATALGLSGADRARFDAASRGRPAPLVSLPRVEPLIGRDGDVAGVVQLLAVADLVTIVGLTGVGKAVLAITVANEVVSRFPGGVGAIRVTEVSTEPEVLASAASALAAAPLDEGPFRPPDDALLVVTNIDRSPAAATAAISWLRQHTGVRILATSRAPLGVPGEHQWVLGPLEVPPPGATGAAVFDYPATRLFLDRLRRVRARPLTEADAGVLGELVRRLGGLPFALQLAAARGRVLDLPELLSRTGTADEAAAGEPAADPAGQTVRSAVLACWGLLTPVEQTALCWLSVFQWRWSIELAEELLAACPEVAHGDVVALVDRLVGLGLVRARGDTTGDGSADASGGGALRLHVFDAVRRVAHEQAQARGILAAAGDQHARVIAQVCARATPGSGDGAVPTAASAGRTAVPTQIAYLLADIQAAADHLGVRAGVPRPRAGSGPADAADDLRRGLVQWLGT